MLIGTNRASLWEEVADIIAALPSRISSLLQKIIIRKYGQSSGIILTPPVKERKSWSKNKSDSVVFFYFCSRTCRESGRRISDSQDTAFEAPLSPWGPFSSFFNAESVTSNLNFVLITPSSSSLLCHHILLWQYIAWFARWILHKWNHTVYSLLQLFWGGGLTYFKIHWWSKIL